MKRFYGFIGPKWAKIKICTKIREKLFAISGQIRSDGVSAKEYNHRNKHFWRKFDSFIQ